MLSRKWLSYTRPWLLLVAFFAACTDETNSRNPNDTWEGMCLDQDGDGFGVECEQGEDCDDSDPNLNVSCGCAVPNEGCSCEASAEPVDCVLSREHTESGGMLCKTGVRYCQDGLWSSCTGIRSFEVPAPSVAFGKLGTAAIAPDAALVICDACKPDCYHVDDPLGMDSGTDASIPVPNGHDVAYTPGGDITLSTHLVDSGVRPPTVPRLSGCATRLTDTDCNGVPDKLDEDYGKPKVANQLPAIFMELGPENPRAAASM